MCNYMWHTSDSLSDLTQDQPSSITLSVEANRDSGLDSRPCTPSKLDELPCTPSKLDELQAIPFSLQEK